MLTRRQAQLLHFLADYLVKSDGVAPTFDEMQAGLGLKSKSGIHRLLTGLEERGFIARGHNRARCIEVIRVPEPIVMSPEADLATVISALVGKIGAASTARRLQWHIDSLVPSNG